MPSSSPTVIPAKVRPPILGVDLVRRGRLTDLLDASAARVVLVSAPAGWGKTVLALEWLAGREDGVAWLSVDVLDNDPGRFFAHLAAALHRTAVPALRRAAEALADLPPDSVHDPAPEVLAALADAPPGQVVVLDDVHLLDDSRVWTFIADLVAGPPPGVRLVLLSREDPPLRLGRLRLSGELLEIRERELRFTTAESAHLFRTVGTLGLGDEAVAVLVERTEGWAAGLRLANSALQVAEDPEAAAATFGGSHQLLADYLLEEALRGRGPDLTRFLMETSILPRFTEETCRFVTAADRAGEHLREVEEANLFLTSLDPQRTWYRYHHLFAELLTFRLERLEPERLAVLRERASAWFEHHGELPEALAQAAEHPDPELLVRILDRHGYDMLARSEFAAFARWLERIPDPAAYRWPMFLAAVAWFHVQVDVGTDLDRWTGRLDEALADPPGDYPPEALAEARLHREVIRAFWLRVHGRLEDAVRTAEWILDEAPAGAAVLRGITEFHIAAVWMRLGKMPEARSLLERARETTRRGNAPYIFLASLGHLGAVLAQIEGVPAALRHLREAEEVARDRRLDGLPAFGIILYQLADVLAVADDRDGARDQLLRALQVTRGERQTDIHANVLIRLARLDALEERFDRAEGRLAEAAVVARGQSLQPFGTTIELEQARLDERATGRLLPPSDELASDPGVGERWSIVREAEAVLRMQQALKDGREGEAARLAERLEEMSRPRNRGVALSLALLTRAGVTGEAAERYELLREALTLAERNGYVRPLLDGGGPVRRLLEVGLHAGLPDHLRDFLRERLLPGLPSDAPGPSLPGPERLGLTERERELLVRLAGGLTNRELAKALFVSENTVKTHLKHIYAKLDVSTRTAAADRARSLGLLEDAAP